MIPVALGLVALLGVPGPVRAALKGEAEFTRVINDVRVLPTAAAPAPAKVGDRISGSTAVSTGVKSRAELRFPDNTLTRLGANSVFRMDQATKTVEVDKGVILLQVPKQLGGANVRTAAVTAAVTGTTLMVEFMPDGFIKIIVIEGEVDVFLNSKRSVFRTLTPGDLWMTRSDDDSHLPAPVKIDLGRLKATSKLMDEAEFGPLGNLDQVQSALDDQAARKQDGELLVTSFRIEGRGRQVTLTQGERQHVLGVEPPPRAPAKVPAPAVVRKPPRTVGSSPVEPERPTKPVNVPDTTVVDGDAIIRTGSGILAYNRLAGTFVTLPATEYRPGEDGPFNTYMYDDESPAGGGLDGFLAGRERWFAFKGDEIYISGNPSIDSTDGPRDLIFGATGNVVLTDTPPFPGDFDSGSVWDLGSSVDSLVLTSHSGSILVDDFSLVGTTQDVGFFALGSDSDVDVRGTDATARVSVPEGSWRAHAGRDVGLEGAGIEAGAVGVTAGRDVRLTNAVVESGAVAVEAGRDVLVGSDAVGGATVAARDSIRIRAERHVTITNSSQLRRLTEVDNPGVLIESLNGDITLLDNASVDGDVVEMLAQRGNISIVNAAISGREIGARVLDTGGTLVISNATLGRGANPADLIRLYGEGAGGVWFTGNTTLNGNQVDIAGRNVTIYPGSRVRLSNPGGTRVFADEHNYNGPSSGKFTGLDDRQVDVRQGTFQGRPSYRD